MKYQFFMIGTVAGACLNAAAATYYASPSGTSDGAGTAESPYDIATAVSKATKAGDIVQLLDGTYDLEATLSFNGNSLYGNPADRRAVVLNGCGNVRCLDLQSGTVRDLTVSNGNSKGNSDVRGGGIYLTNAGRVDNCVVTHCTTKEQGGGIRGEWVGTPATQRYYVSNSEICYCSRPDGSGGGISVCCGTISNCFIHSNTSRNYAGLATSCQTPSPGAGTRIFDCVFSNNVSTSDGGAIGNHWESLRGCTFVDNTSGNRGGAIATGNNASYTNAVYDCHFIRNKAAYNGAIYAQQPFMVISNSTFDSCSVPSFANGAVGCSDSNTTVFEVFDSVFTNCTAKQGGGAFYLTAVASCGTHRLSNCHFYDCSASDGGAICLTRGQLSATKCAFHGCKSSNAGGAVCYKYKSSLTEAGLDFTDCRFLGNVSGAGGAFYLAADASQAGASNFLRNEVVTFRRCLFATNYSSGHGSSVYQTGGTYVFADCDFTNLTVQSRGAALYASGGTNRFDRCRFNDIRNTGANQDAAAICITAGRSEIDSCAFTNCVATYNGAGIFSSGGELVVSNTFFSGCSASLTAAGIYMNGSYGEISRCTFVGLRGEYQDAAVCVNPSDTTRTTFVRNCLFDDCTVSSHTSDGLAFRVYPGVLFENCTVVGTLLWQGATARRPVSMYGGTMNNCLFYSNGVLNASGQIATDLSISFNDLSGTAYRDYVLASVSNCLMKAGSFGTTYGAKLTTDACTAMGWVFSDDPKFADAAKGDYTPSRKSPARGKGLVLAWMDGAKDLAGNDRLQGGLVDIGAYQYVPPRGLTLIVR